jgi:hypothetical protein
VASISQLLDHVSSSRYPSPRRQRIRPGDCVAPRGDERALLRDDARSTANGLELRRGLSYDAWVNVGSRIARISNASVWWLGDWVIYGEQSYGMRYRAALRTTALDYQTLRNYAWVARAFEPFRRRAGVSFQHHAEVAARPQADQDLWLERAERLQWSRNELRRRLRADMPPADAGVDERAMTLRVRVTTDREQKWRQAAEAADQALPDWIAAAADNAAEAVLEARFAEPIAV